MAKDVLEPLGVTGEGEIGEAARLILDRRHSATALSLFLDPWSRQCTEGDARVRSTVYTLGTSTGRMSSVRANLQQISKQGGIRPCIVADTGYTFISADFEGVEIKFAAALSQDEQLIQMIADGRDLHSEIALIAFGPEPGSDKPSKAHRYIAKRIVFGRLYGGGLETLAAQAGCSLEVAQMCIDVLDRLTPRLRAWSENLKAAIKAGRTQFPSYSGRVIHLTSPHSGPNFAIQGSAREALVDGLLRWEQTPWGGAVILPVHDEILAMVPEQDGPAATAALVECMTSSVYGVPIDVDPSDPSPFWADAA